MVRKAELAVALDVFTFEEARKIIDSCGEKVEIFKVGSQLFTSCGPVIVRYLMANGKKVFLDLKFHDIPNTVANAVASAVGLSSLGHDVLDNDGNKKEINPHLFMCTLHTVGGEEMLQRAVSAAKSKSEELGVKPPILVGITVLTSDKGHDNTEKVVLERARLARQSGLDGVVASSQEAALIRKEFGEEFIIVTPGIRPLGGDVGDQKRVTTPSDAVKNGSNFLVVGRPIVKAANPAIAADDILKEMKEAG